MASETTIRKENNFGALRLLFASLVIVSHSPIILSGTAENEPLVRVFGTMTFGSVAVDGFFIVSGYLILKSFLGTGDLFDYFKKRVLRIYPGFIVNFSICVLLLAPLVGAGLAVFQPRAIALEFTRMVRLMQPYPLGAFQDMPLQSLNGAVWTISYEFKCYILVALLGVLGAYKAEFRALILIGVLAFLTLNALDILPDTTGVVASVFGSAPALVRFAGVFGVGMLYYLFRDRIVYDGRMAIAAAAIVLISMYFQRLAEFSLTVFGGYLIFWFAFKMRTLRISLFTNRTDLSYGIYLYAFPIQNTIAHLDRSINPWALSAISLAGAAGAAYLSWTFIEKPSLAVAHRAFPRLRTEAPVRSPLVDGAAERGGD